jgi:hypothetical protein
VCPEQRTVLPIESLTGAQAIIRTPNADVCAQLIGGRVACWRESPLDVSTHEELAPPVDARALEGIGAVAQLAQSSDLPRGSVGSVALGGFACARTEAGEVYCWGMNGHGELGTADGQRSAKPARIPGLASATQISLGASHGCALVGSGEVSCWGNDERGQLGIGRNRFVASPVPVRLPWSEHQ